MTNPVAQFHPPGVWIYETTPPGPISGVSTSVAAFIGQVNRSDAQANKPVMVTSWADFVNQFSNDPNKPAETPAPDKSKAAEADKPATRKKEPDPAPPDGGSSTASTGTPPTTPNGETPPAAPAVRDPFGSDMELPFAVRGFYENGGSLAYIVPVQNLESTSVAEALTRLKAYGDVGLVCAPGVTDKGVQGVIVEHCRAMGDRFAILDGLWPAETAPEKPATQKDKKDDADKATKATKATATEATADPVTPPDTGTTPNPTPTPTPEPQTGAGTSAEVSTSVLVTNTTGARLELDPGRAYGAVYWPWLVTAGKPTDPPKTTRTTAPSGHIAGVFARTDANFGVHKAPANELVQGVTDVTVRLDDDNHTILNNAHINAIRIFPGRPPLIWGARTLSTDDSWKFVNVRRLMNYIEESIVEGTRWAVFKPNNQTLWKGLDRTITEFLSRVWRGGALFGATAEQAFYVKIDESNNPRDLVDEGILTIEIGVSPVRPAEFIVIQIGQWDGGTRITEI